MAHGHYIIYLLGALMDIECCFCGCKWNTTDCGNPYLIFQRKYICCDCYLKLIEIIYAMAGHGDGGLIHLIFESCLTSNINKKNRKSLKTNKNLFQKLLHKYKFTCCFCKEKDEKKLTIDHIRPVCKGGSDDFSNLQILCKSCNSKKGTKWKG